MFTDRVCELARGVGFGLCPLSAIKKRDWQERYGERKMG